MNDTTTLFTETDDAVTHVCLATLLRILRRMKQDDKEEYMRFLEAVEKNHKALLPLYRSKRTGLYHCQLCGTKFLQVDDEYNETGLCRTCAKDQYSD